MKKSKSYYNIKFFSSVIREAHELFVSKLESGEKKEPSILSISMGHENWEYDNPEEFFAEYSNASSYVFDHIISFKKRLRIVGDRYNVTVTVEFPNRSDIQSVFNIFEKNLENCGIEVLDSEIDDNQIKIFIGHGNNNQWRDLKDHLQDHHGFEVESYEIGPRAGLSVKEVLESMLDNSSFALLVLTGEDIDTYGELHARENVIHEVGLFQGRLGFKRAIVLLEESTHEFSNILGLNQIKFSKGNIRETFGDVLATIKREFE